MWNQLTFAHPAPNLLSAGMASGVVIAATVADIRHRIVPNRLIVFSLVPGFALLFWDPSFEKTDAIYASLSIGAVLIAVRQIGKLIFKRPGLGMGDVKLGIVLGMFLQWHVLPIFYIASCLAAMTGISGMVIGRLVRSSRIPFVPFIALSAFGYGWYFWIH